MEQKKFIDKDAILFLNNMGIDINNMKFKLNDLVYGLNVELEHGTKDPQTNVTNDDLMMTGKIALAHLKEFPDYYVRLSKLEKEAEEYWKNLQTGGLIKTTVTILHNKQCPYYKENISKIDEIKKKLRDNKIPYKEKNIKQGYKMWDKMVDNGLILEINKDGQKFIYTGTLNNFINYILKLQKQNIDYNKKAQKYQNKYRRLMRSKK